MAKAEKAALLILGFLSGAIIAGAHGPFKWAVFVTLLPALFGIYRRTYFWLGLVAIGICCGGWYYHAFFGLKAAEMILPERGLAFEATVTSEPSADDRMMRAFIRLEKPYHGEALLLTSHPLRYGDLLRLEGAVHPPSGEREPPSMYFPAVQTIEANRASRAKYRLLDFKARLLRSFTTALPADEAAFLGGITLGAKGALSDGLRKAMRLSGTTHLTALSGYNIQILVWALFGLLLRVVPRQVAAVFLVVIIALFTIMTGAEHSIVRAAIMGSMVLCAKQVGRSYSFDFAILWTALAMVLWDPGAPFELGFQLSFASLLGITYLAPALRHRLRRGADRTSDTLDLGDIAIQTVSAQCAVLPILLQAFGAVSLAGLIANMLILPVVPVTMLLGFVFAGYGLLIQGGDMIMGTLLNLLLAYQLGVIRFFARFPVSLALSWSWWASAAYYASVAALIAGKDNHGRA